MRCRILRGLSVLALCGSACAVQAGPWPRDEGAVFLSLSQEQDADANGYTSLYGEYGLGARITMGLEAGRSNTGDATVLVWVERGFGTGPLRYATSLGFGLSRREGQMLPVGQLGLSLGRGFATGFGDGWAVLDTRVQIAAKPMAEAVQVSQSTTVLYEYLIPETGVKSELTLGLKPWQGTMLIGQLRMVQTVDQDFGASLSAAVVRDLGGQAKIELGLVQPLTGENEPALRLGTWLSF